MLLLSVPAAVVAPMFACRRGRAQQGRPGAALRHEPRPPGDCQRGARRSRGSSSRRRRGASTGRCPSDGQRPGYSRVSGDGQRGPHGLQGLGRRQQYGSCTWVCPTRPRTQSAPAPASCDVMLAGRSSQVSLFCAGCIPLCWPRFSLFVKPLFLLPRGSQSCGPAWAVARCRGHILLYESSGCCTSSMDRGMLPCQLPQAAACWLCLAAGLGAQPALWHIWPRQRLLAGCKFVFVTSPSPPYCTPGGSRRAM
jgi:hypothetical protein